MEKKVFSWLKFVYFLIVLIWQIRDSFIIKCLAYVSKVNVKKFGKEFSIRFSISLLALFKIVKSDFREGMFLIKWKQMTFQAYMYFTWFDLFVSLTYISEVQFYIWDLFCTFFYEYFRSLLNFPGAIYQMKAAHSTHIVFTTFKVYSLCFMVVSIYYLNSLDWQFCL